MTKYQRAKIRIERDKRRKAELRSEKFKYNDNFNSVITMQHFVEALGKCHKGVGWKGSVQKYTHNAIVEIERTVNSLRNGVLPELTSVNHIVLYERGKRREIVPITIRDRMTQRVLCDNALVPVLQNSLIYDNGASMKGKGVDFARKRLVGHLQQAVKEYGSEFYILTFDFKSFFDSIPHQTCLNILNKGFTDKHIKGLTMAIIKSYEKSVINRTCIGEDKTRLLNRLNNNQSHGICLGSQISQIMALVVPNKLDHYVKDQRKFKHYIRYMDDGMVISDSKEALHQLYAEMKKIAKELGLTFNEKKTRVVKSTRGFVFMKVRYRITPTGKIVSVLTKAGIVRMRRKLKKFRRLVDNGDMTLEAIRGICKQFFTFSMIFRSAKPPYICAVVLP